MTVLPAEVGAIAAENIAEIMTRAGSATWATLVEGGWTAIGADADAGLDVRDLQEIARVAGRSTTPLPLVTTLLAGRWFGMSASTPATGASFPVLRGEEAVIPYAVDGITVLDAEARPVPADALTGPRDDFSTVMPLAGTTDAAPVITGGHAAEFRAVLAAVAVGCADEVADRTVAWAQTREQFGRPISAFQAVRHHLADLHIAREQAWTAAIAGAHEQDASATWARQACERSIAAIELGIQVHGGVGFTAEVGLHLHLDHVLQIATLIGGDA